MIHLYVHGRGRGHTTRSQAIFEALVGAGHQVRAFVGPDGFELFAAAHPCEPIASLPPTPTLAGSWLLSRRVAAAVRAGRNDRVQLVVSDGDLPGLLASKLLRRPSVAVGHGLVFAGCARPPSLPPGPWMREAAKAVASAPVADRRIAVNFVPLRPRTRRTVLARPSLDPRLHRAPVAGEVLCYFRDPALPVLRMAAELGLGPRLFSATDPGIPGVRHSPLHRARFIEALAAAEVVIASAGSQLISECVGLGIPVLALFDPQDDEQRLNAGMVRDARLGDGCSFDALTPRRLERFVRAPPRGRIDLSAAPQVGAAVVDEAARALVGIAGR